METNFAITGLVILAAIALIIYLIRKNQKDKNKFEQDLNQSELKPDKHEDEQRRM
jgi:hypothetical protein